MVPVWFGTCLCFGTRLDVSLAAPKGVSKRMGFKMASFPNFERWAFGYPFVLVLVCQRADFDQKVPLENPVFFVDIFVLFLLV